MIGRRRFALLLGGSLAVTACHGAGDVAGAGGDGAASPAGGTPGWEAEACVPGLPGGTLAWSEQFGSEATAGATSQVVSIAVDGAGDVVVAGAFGGRLDLGCGALEGIAGGTVLLAKLDPGGACLWSQSLGATRSTAAGQVAVDGAGNVVLSGAFQGTFDLGGHTLASQEDAQAMFVARFDPQGDPLGSQAFAGQDQITGAGVALDAQGDAVVLGGFTGSFLLDGRVVSVPGQAADGVLVAKLDPGGDPLWDRAFANVDPVGVAVDASGNVVVAAVASTPGSLDFGCGAIDGVVENAGVLVKLDPGGDCLWSVSLGSASATSFGLDGAGSTLVAGNLGDDVPGGLALAKITAGGAVAWTREVTGSFEVPRVAVDAAGDALVSGTFTGTVDFGQGADEAGPTPTGYLVDVGPAGEARWSAPLGDPLAHLIGAIAVDASCHVLVGGQHTNASGSAVTNAYLAELVR